MRVLVFDTETTGLPDGKPSFYNTSKWPYIIQLSYILYDVYKNQILVCNDDIIKLDKSVKISEKSVEMHKITYEISQEKGIDISEALSTFNKCIEKSDVIIGHNLSFDKNMIIVEDIRNKSKKNIFRETRSKNKDKNKQKSNTQVVFPYNKQYYCTMKNTIDFCAITTYSDINNVWYNKYPNLSELYQKLFDTIPNPQSVHNSLVDILLCLRCYIRYKQNLDILNNSAVKKMYNEYQLS